MQKEEEKYKGKSISDDLTGLLNRSYGEKMLSTAVESGKGAVTLISGIDYFIKNKGVFDS